MAAILLFFSLFASPHNMVRLRAFVIGTVMHLFLGYIHRRMNASVANILEVMIFLKIEHSALFELICIGFCEIAMNFFG